MGGGSSKAKILQESINNISSEVVASASGTASGAVIQEAKITAVGKDSVVRNVSILQEAKINLSIMQDSSVNASMQADMVTKIMAEIEKAKTDFPQVSKNKSKTDIHNVIKNNVSNKMSTSSIMSISLDINQSAEVAAVSGGLVETVKIAQAADAVGEAINTMSGDILSDIGITSELEGKAKETTTFFGADLVNAVGDAVNNIVGTISDAFGISPQMIFLFIIIVIVGYMLAEKQIEKTGSIGLPGPPRMPMRGIPGRRPPPTGRRPPQGRGPPPAPPTTVGAAWSAPPAGY